MQRSRPKRLPHVDYVGLRRYFLTICCSWRHLAFTDDEPVTLAYSALTETCTKHGFQLLAYCFMPDHFHALLEGQFECSDFAEFVRQFKQISAFRYRRLRRKELWQPGYYEHVLRGDESTFAVARYILENPIRAGITRELGEYPHAGSAVWTLEEMVDFWRQGPT